jgi:hypothetical protein
MIRKMTLPLVAGLSVFGAAAGVWLGRSAVAEINPAYYGGLPDRFHADRAAIRPPLDPPQAAFADASLAEGLGTGCIGCTAGPVVIYAPPVPRYDEGWAADARRGAEPIEAVRVETAPDPERERVVRYASYPVSSDEAAAAHAEAMTETGAGAGDEAGLGTD